jgi:hypothetical protein
MESKRSESIANLAAALAVAQGQIAIAPEDSVADTGKFKYNYATLDSIWEACRKPLSENGLSVVQIPTNDEAGISVETILLHSSGEWISGTITLPVASGRMSESQAVGSAITYARRYTLGAIVGVATGADDDGQAAGGRPDKAEAPILPVMTSHTMTPQKLLKRLNQESEINGFYGTVENIFQSVFTEGRTWPAPEDIDAWKLLFDDAKQHALEAIEQTLTPPDETDQGDLEAEYPEIFNNA